jgi:Flp pilus assembly protein TadD/Fe-S-cluster containining protein
LRVSASSKARPRACANPWKKVIVKLVQAGKTKEAISLASQYAQKHNPDEVASHLVDLGVALGKERSLHNDALTLFKAASSIATGKTSKDYANANAGVALTIIGSSLAEKGQLKEAEESFRKAVHLNPGFSLAHQGYARCLGGLGKMKQAEYHFKVALKLNPKDPMIHVQYAMLSGSMQKLSRAIVHLKQALELAPDNPDIHACYGIALLNNESFGEAESEFKRAIDLQPSNMLAHYNYGILLGKTSRWSEAEAQLNEVFDVEPSFEHVRELYPHSILMKHSLNPQEPITKKWQWARRRYFETERPLDEEDFTFLEKHRKQWKIIYDKFSCEMCGRCCKGTKWALNLDTRLIWEDVERWRRQKRHDILRYVLVFESLGGDLLDLENKKFLSICPFIEKKANKKYVCSIHETKPFACKVTPFYFHNQGVCENCKGSIQEKDIYCRNCGMFLRADAHMLLSGCPGLEKALKASGLYKPFRRHSLF